MTDMALSHFGRLESMWRDDGIKKLVAAAAFGGIGLKAAAQWRECTTIPRRQHYAHALFLLVNREL